MCESLGALLEQIADHLMHWMEDDFRDMQQRGERHLPFSSTRNVALAWLVAPLQGIGRHDLVKIIETDLKSLDESVKDVDRGERAGLKGSILNPIRSSVKVKTNAVARKLRAWAKLDLAADAVRANETGAAVRDGPRLPNHFICDGEEHEIRPLTCRLLDYMWQRDRAEVEEVVHTVWGEHRNDSTVSTELNRANNVLRNHESHVRLRRKSGYIERYTPKVTKKSPAGKS